MGLSDLPPEVLLLVLAKLSPRDLVALSATSSSFNEFVKSDPVWQRFLSSLSHLYSPSLSSPPSSASAYSIARFLLPNSRYLGYSLSSTPFTSRLIRLSLSLSPTPTILASQLLPHNLFSLSSTNRPRITLPTGAVLDPTLTSYHVPHHGPGSHTPDKGFSVDLLEPEWKWCDLFSVTETSGAILSLSTDNDTRRTGIITPSLRLILVRAEKKVRSATREEERVRLRRQTNDLLALFTGRLPDVEWPTRDLLVNGLRRARDWVRDSDDDWQDGGSSEEDALISGFRLQVRRKVVLPATNSTALVPQMTPAARQRSVDEETVGDEVPRRVMDTAAAVRRRGVGPNGGPAILWNGQEQDPGERTAVAVIRAGETETGPGFIFYVPPTPATTSLQTTNSPSASPPEEREEIVRTEVEEFFPCNAPSRPLSFESPKTISDVDGAVLARSLEGLWVGSYGPHGIEFGWLTVGFVEDEGVRKREIKYSKITGDLNVPSGQISWTCTLPQTSPSSDEEDKLGTVPSVTNAQLLRWSSFDPSSQNSIETPRWELGTVPARGQIALEGFNSPSWTQATLTFVRSEQTLTRDVMNDSGDMVKETRKVEVVDEVRLRWKALHKVSCFRRVRL